MNYRHHYHAGNFADVFKHVVLTAIVRALQRKAKPFCYIETHAGAGKYNLSTLTHSTQECEQGIKLLWQCNDAPDLIRDYLDIVKKFNLSNKLYIYPGSPCLARDLLRPQDRMVLCELQPEVHAQLHQEFAHTPQTRVYLEEGYQMLKALLPPLERRGVVFIDPPFEQANEFTQLIRHITTAYQRWATGVYVIWYPIKSPTVLQKFHRDLIATGIKDILAIQFYVYPPDVELRLNGAGMIVINPPYQVDNQVSHVLPWLRKQLAATQGSYTIKYLTPSD